MDVVNDLVSGAVGGVAGIIVGSPFDVIKVRQQAGISKANAFQTAVNITRNEGPGTFFRGILPPIVGNFPLNALVFASYGFSSRILDEKFPQLPPPPDQMPTPPLAQKEQLLAELKRQIPGLTMSQLDKNTTFSYQASPQPNFMNLFLGGCFSGLATAFLIAPIELLKIKEQNYMGEGKVPSPWFIMKDLTRKNGFRSLFQGFISTCLREVPSNGVYFGVYELFKYLLRTEVWTPVITPKAPESSVNYALPLSLEYQYNVNYSVPATLAAGSVAGVASWFSTYPIDVIKTKIQTMPFEDYKTKGTILKVARASIAQAGVKSLFSGLGATLTRAVPVNAVTFLLYEQTLALLRSAQTNAPPPHI